MHSSSPRRFSTSSCATFRPHVPEVPAVPARFQRHRSAAVPASVLEPLGTPIERSLWNLWNSWNLTVEPLMKRIAILGSTGSIGTSALDVARMHRDRVEVVAIAAATNVAAMVKQILEFRPRAVAMATGEAMDKLRAALGGSPAEISGVGNEGLCEIASHPDVDIVLCASSGTAALDAVLCAIDAGKTIALANKEVLVMAGGLVMDAARRKGVAVLPVDSEHNAIHQCLHGRASGELRRLILTASGGPFRGQIAERAGQGHRRRRAEAPDLADGPEDHHRFGDADEQGARGDRGALAVWRARLADRRRRSPAVDRALDGRVEGRIDHRADGHHRHAAADSIRVRVSRSLGRAGAVSRSHQAESRSSFTSRRGTIFRACAWPTAPSKRSAACRSC